MCIEFLFSQEMQKPTPHTFPLGPCPRDWAVWPAAAGPPPSPLPPAALHWGSNSAPSLHPFRLEWKCFPPFEAPCGPLHSAYPLNINSSLTLCVSPILGVPSLTCNTLTLQSYNTTLKIEKLHYAHVLTVKTFHTTPVCALQISPLMKPPFTFFPFSLRFCVLHMSHLCFPLLLLRPLIHTRMPLPLPPLLRIHHYMMPSSQGCLWNHPRGFLFLHISDSFIVLPWRRLDSPQRSSFPPSPNK